MVARPAWPPKSAPRLFVQSPLAASASITLTGNQAHYLTKVMRAAPGDTVILCDNESGEWAAEITEAGKRQVILTALELLRPREAVPDFWLCPALLKKDRFDIVLEKATELGAAAIKPVIMRRCVADKLNLERARTITTEAAEQCARTALPAVSAPQKLAALLAEWPKARHLFFADEDGGKDAEAAFHAVNGPAAIMLGPEGGFDDAERDMLLKHESVTPISLGPRILRGETAAIAATALWMACKGDWTNNA